VGRQRICIVGQVKGRNWKGSGGEHTKTDRQCRRQWREGRGEEKGGEVDGGRGSEGL